MDVFIINKLEPATEPMNKEAVSAGFYKSELWQKQYPKIQILTIEELLKGKQIQMFPDIRGFKQAQIVEEEAKQGEFKI